MVLIPERLTLAIEPEQAKTLDITALDPGGNLQEAIGEWHYVYGLLALVKETDLETFEHLISVGRTVDGISEFMNIPTFQRHATTRAGVLHDIAKIHPKYLSYALDEHDFNPEQKIFFQGHARGGYDIIAAYGDLDAANRAVKHHEPGYPRRQHRSYEDPAVIRDGLHLRIADEIDALGRKRRYKVPWPVEQIQNKLSQSNDPMLVSKAIEIWLHVSSSL